MSHEPMRVGLLGAGMIATAGYGYLPGLKHIPDKAVLVALCDPVIDRARQVAQQYGVSAVFGRYEEMLEWGEFDLLLNLTPIPHHGPATLQALAAGKHVVSEKPLATTMADADAIVETARARGLTVVCAPPNMLHPTRQRARRIVEAGDIGKIAFARVRSSHGGPAAAPWPADPTWFYQEGSGPLFDMGVYGVHDITGILGPARRVFGMSGITEPRRVVREGPFAGKRIDVTTDDNTLLMLDFGESTFAMVDGTFNVNASRSPAVEIFGRAGTLNLASLSEIPTTGQPEPPPLELFRLDAATGIDGWVTPRGWLLDQALDRVNLLQRTAVVEHLVDCVRSGQPPILSAEHARHALEIMLEGIAAARSGRAVELRTTF